MIVVVGTVDSVDMWIQQMVLKGFPLVDNLWKTKVVFCSFPQLLC